MSDERNVFVLFAAGTGGNHIANLLSTDPTFLTRATVADYQQHTELNAHVSTSNNLRLDEIQQVTGYDRNVFCGHWAEYYWLYANHELEKFNRRQIVVVSLPASGTLAYQRYSKFAPTSIYHLEEQRSLYTPLTIERMFGEKDWFVFDPVWVFDESLDKFFEFAHDEMSLNLDHDQCVSMHSVWFNRIKRSVDC